MEERCGEYMLYLVAGRGWVLEGGAEFGCRAFRVFVMCRRHEAIWYFVHASLLYFCNLFNSGLKDF